MAGQIQRRDNVERSTRPARASEFPKFVPWSLRRSVDVTGAHTQTTASGKLEEVQSMTTEDANSWQEEPCGWKRDTNCLVELRMAHAGTRPSFCRIGFEIGRLGRPQVPPTSHTPRLLLRQLQRQ